MMSIATETKNIHSDILATLELEGTTRLQAFEEFKKNGLPSVKNEEYKFTPITRILEKNFDFANTDRAEVTLKSITPFDIDNLDAQRIVLVNGEFSKTLSSFDQTKIKILSKTDWPKKLATVANFKEDALVAWNTAAWTAGVHIEVADNIQLEKPIVIHHILDTAQAAVKSFTRVLVEIGKSSSATVIEKLGSTENNHPGFSSVVTEGLIQENGELNYYSIQADSNKRYHFSQTTFDQKRNSRVNCFTLTLDGKLIRNNLRVILDGEGCESHLNGLYLVQGETLIDNHSVVDHTKPNSYSNELYKGILDGASKGVFNGKIFVRPDAQKTNAFQSNRNIILSDKATVNTKPQLEIWADDVKCSHGCTTGQLDEEAIFYLRTRGINKETAQAMVLYAFAGEVLDTVKSDVMKTYIDGLISERLHKNF